MRRLFFKLSFQIVCIFQNESIFRREIFIVDRCIFLAKFFASVWSIIKRRSKDRENQITYWYLHPLNMSLAEQLFFETCDYIKWSKNYFLSFDEDNSASFAAKSFNGSIRATCLASRSWDSNLGCNRCNVCITLSSFTSE